MSVVDNYTLLIDKVNTFIRKYYLNNLLRGLIFLGAGLLSAYLVIVVLEYFGNFDIALRSILFYSFVILNLFLVAWLVIPSLLAYLKLGKTLTHDEAAEIIGLHFQDVKDKLLNTLQLKKLANEDARHRLLIEASINQKIETLKPVSFPSAINLKENARYLKWVIGPFVIIAILAIAAPAVLTESTKRLIKHDQYFAPVAPFKFVVLNSSLSVMQGQDLKLEVKLDGNQLPANLYLETGSNTFKLDKQTLTRFQYLFTNLQQNTSFRLTANGFTSATYQVKVNQKPALLNFDVVLNYPAYLHKATETLSNAGDMTLPAGTSVEWQLHTRAAQQLAFSINQTQRQLTPAKTDVFTHTERIYRNTTYTVQPLTSATQAGEATSYRINVIADEMPAITVQEKQDSVSSKALYFSGNIQDDHGFSSLTFHYRTEAAGSKSKTVSLPVKANLSQTQADFFYYWNLKDLNITPGSQITYYFEVADNDGVNGPKSVRSAEHTLQAPTEQQMNEQLNAGTQVVKQKMQSAIKMAGQLEREAQKLNQLLLNKTTLSFDEKKQIEDLLKRKAELNDLIKDIKEDNQKNLYNRRENQQQSQELQEKQKEIENLFNNALDDKTQELLKKLQNLLQQEQKDATRDEIAKMQNNNKSIKKELDRMLELYKQLDFEQKLNENVNQLNKLAEQQQKLAEQTQQSGTDKQQLQQEQQKLQQDFQNVKKSLDDLSKANEQLERRNNFDKPEKDENAVEQSMQNSKDELQKNNRSKSAQAQQQTAKRMQQMASKMQQNEQEGEQEQNRIDVQQLRELLKVLVNSSFNQEKVMQSLRGMSSNDPSYVNMAQKQKDIKDNLKTAEDTLYALSRRIPQIQATVNQEVGSINDHIDKALENLGDRRTPEANRNQQYAMTSMNNLALMLSEALEHLQNSMNSGKGGGKKQQSIAQLSQMQQQLNQNMQKMREQLQQQGNQGKSQQGGQQNQAPGSSMSEQLARMARQQQQIRQQLEQLNRENNKDGTGKLGNLDKIAKDMEQTESDLVNKKITEESLKRQQQIQTRMLEAEKAEQEREQDKQRESQAGKDLPPGYIKALQGFQQHKAKQTEQLQTVPSALNLYYKQKIKRYFSQINAK
ncbi:hypothetical protein HH214_09890 [Mucilaginibacter robiniae]|uniref:DUF4175 family protein n=1 Tax=Mucilaginibacter robiniae TaxID=2728022 RepID=A0A7L5E0X0_9SPHI|nr:DUF4175 family protein [Mucilaginibacter robiniae]QJD96158.1 hypothetical protein HH214_09890 [Mucilaginibacter robiniae]